MKIYIDHFPEQDNFAEKLRDQLRSLSPDIEVSTFYDKRNESEISNFEGEVEVKVMNNSDIVIPIVTSQYLAENNEATEGTLSELSNNKDKSIFPIIYSPANWSSKNWIVKSNIFPSSNDSYTELDSNEQILVINNLVNTVGNIISDKKTKKPEKVTKAKKRQDINEQIFISHSNTDADFAELLKLHLEKNGIDCWMDTERLRIGQDWREEIDSGISMSKAVIAIMSPEARKSEYVTYEWAFAWGKGIKILPIMLSQTSLHPRLESLQYMDFTNRVTRPYDDLVKRIKEIKN